MTNFIGLVRNEHMKIYKKLSTYIMIVILIVLTILPTIIIKYVNNYDFDGDWGNEEYLQYLNETLEDKSLSKDDRIYYESEIQKTKYKIENNIERGSWQEEVTWDMFESYGGLEEEEQADFDEEFATLDQFIKSDDWKGYLNHRKGIIEELTKEDSEAAANNKIELEVIEMRLKYEAPQVRTPANWKSDVISQYYEAAMELEWAKERLEDQTIDKRDREYFEELLDREEKKIAIAKHRVENDIKPVNDDSQWGFMRSVGPQIIFNLIAVFIAIVASGIVAGEFSNGTIKLLLIRPNERWQVLVSKYTVLFIYTIELLLISSIIGYLSAGIFFGFEGVPTFLYIKGGAVMEQSYLLRLLFETLLQSVPLVIVFTMSFMISTAFKSAGLSIGLSVFLLLTGPSVTLILAELRFKPAKYLITANWNLINYFMDDKSLIPFKGMTFTFSLVNVLVYFIVANIITFTIFTKRDVAT